MTDNPSDRKYTSEHVWVRQQDDGYLVGITDHAQNELGDIVFVEMPSIGDVISQGQKFAVVESVKTASEVYAPIDGKIIAVNEEVDDSPELINSDPYTQGWLVKLENSSADIDRLLDASVYADSVL